MKLTSYSTALLVASLAALPSAAFAQRTNDNAVKKAEDAFGTSVGDEQIGIYNANLVRGFSPVAAGNLRIEGLYFDQQARPIDRLMAGTVIHVGISAQGYPFPAPTGIADYKLRRPGAKHLTSLSLSLGPWEGAGAELDVQLPLDGDRAGLAFGVGRYRDGQPHHGTGDLTSLALLGRYSPVSDFEILPFWSQFRVSGEQSQSLIFTTTGDFLPAPIARDRFLGQKWSDYSGTSSNYGVVTKARIADFDLSLGVFRSQVNVDEDHIDLLFGTDRSGQVANRVVVVDGGNRYGSTSGEVRVARSMVEGPRLHKLILSLRGRDQSRVYGGAGSVSLGQSRIGVQDFRPEQTAQIGAKTRGEVTQKTLGLGYEGRWAGLGELSLGLQKTDYAKSVKTPDPARVVPPTYDKPWLFSSTGAVYVAENIAAYAGYTRGLEESPVAPAEAANRNEAPPAIRTTQKEAGLRWKPAPGVSAVLGYFDIEKPYFNLDAAQQFRQLGQVRNRGVEFSVAGPLAKGLYVVAGNVWLDARVAGEEVTSGRISRRPIGTFRRHTMASLDYQLPGVPTVSLTAGFESTSSRTANAQDSLRIPARSVLHLGTRYRFKLSGKPVLLRANVQNVFNTFGWAVGGTGFLIPNGSRRYSLSLAADI